MPSTRNFIHSFKTHFLDKIVHHHHKRTRIFNSGLQKLGNMFHITKNKGGKLLTTGGNVEKGIGTAMIVFGLLTAQPEVVAAGTTLNGIGTLATSIGDVLNENSGGRAFKKSGGVIDALKKVMTSLNQNELAEIDILKLLQGGQKTENERGI